MKNQKRSFWGCSLHDPSVLMTLITDYSQQNIIFPTSSKVKENKLRYKVPKYNHLSESLVLTPGSGTTYLVQKDQQLQVWYSETLLKHTTHDNFGTHCVHVFVKYSQTN